MFYSGEAEFVFGTGLSYTSWELEWHARPPPAWSSRSVMRTPTSVAEFGVLVCNTGARAGRRTVLVFARPAANAEATQSRVRNERRTLLQKLVGFDGLASVAPGAGGRVSFRVNLAQALGRADDDGEMRVSPGAYEIVVRDGANELVHAIDVS
jgi:hypothetical protein